MQSRVDGYGAKNLESNYREIEGQRVFCARRGKFFGVFSSSPIWHSSMPRLRRFRFCVYFAVSNSFVTLDLRSNFLSQENEN